MKKVPKDVEKFAAKIADKQDNPTIHELAKAFPNKTYRELEKYRNEDRQQEANKIPLTEAQQNLVNHIEEAIQIHKEGTCIVGEIRKDREGKHYKKIDWETKYDKEHKLRREAEGETSIIKGIGQNSPEMKKLKLELVTTHVEVQALKQQLYADRKELEEGLANALELNESHQKLNGKLQTRVTELEEENKKLHAHFGKQINGARKAGM